MLNASALANFKCPNLTAILWKSFIVFIGDGFVNSENPKPLNRRAFRLPRAIGKNSRNSPTPDTRHPTP
ncbi:MAG: hypothetical protein F6J93_17295 [Oscillatoria sp. SIO1A7]|nr:hypothetical protein [Oscillatoria sp. SIO1A7]